MLRTATATAIRTMPAIWTRVSRSRHSRYAPTAARPANCDARTAAIAIPCRAPTAYDANPATSANPVTTTNFVALPGRGSPEALAALARARLVLLGPGDPQVNVAPALVAPGVRAAVVGSRGLRLWVGSEAGRALVEAWLGEATPAAAPARWESDVQARLLSQAAGRVKTQAG